MLLRSTIGLTCFMAAAVAHVASGKAPAVLELAADGEIQIATDGHVSDYRLKSTLAPAVADLVDRNVRGWKFEPILVNGVPVLAKTAMHLSLQAVPVDGNENYSVKVVHISFGDPKLIGGGKPPRYPEDAVHARLGAKVMLAMRLDATGKVIDVQPYQTSLAARASSEVEAERWRRVFERAAIAAAKTWQYDVSEVINGKPIGTSVMAPIDFYIQNGSQSPPEGWKAYAPGPVHPAPWMDNGKLADSHDLSAIKQGQAQSLDSHFQLRDDVIGKAL